MWSPDLTAMLFLAVLTLVSTRVPRCKESFISVGEWCFSFHLQGASFPKSQEICNEIGGEMVVLDSEEKENMLTEYMEAEGFTYKLAVQNREDLLKSHQRKTIADKHGERFCDFYKKYSEVKSTEELYTPNAKIPVTFNEYDRANLTTPLGFSVKLSSIPNAGLGAWATTGVPIYNVLGVYEGEEFFDDSEYLYGWTLNVDDEHAMTHFVDGASPAKSNWLRYLNCARNDKEEKVNVVLCDDLVFYMTSRDVAPNTELLMWYGTWYGKKFGIRRVHPEDDLDLDDAFYIRVSSLRQDFPGKYSFHDNSTATYTNWIPKKYNRLREREYWRDVEEPFGLLLSYLDGQWNWVPEKDYSYFTGDSGLLLPFVCEDRSYVKQ